MAGFETIQDVADAPVYEVAELPCFGEQTACDAVISARTELQDSDDTNDAVTADDEASEDDETMSVSHSGNPTGDRDDVVAVVAPDGRFEGMDNHEIRLELVRAFDRSPFDVAGVRTAEDFEAIKNVLRAHNQLVADGRMGQLNVLNNTVITPWDETNGKPDVELTTTQSKYGSEHTYWNEAPSERNWRLVDGVDGVIVLSDGGHVESAVYDWVEAGVTVYNAALGETVTWMSSRRLVSSRMTRNSGGWPWPTPTRDATTHARRSRTPGRTGELFLWHRAVVPPPPTSRGQRRRRRQRAPPE
jgi:hypothetical protein